MVQFFPSRSCRYLCRVKTHQLVQLCRICHKNICKIIHKKVLENIGHSFCTRNDDDRSLLIKTGNIKKKNDVTNYYSYSLESDNEGAQSKMVAALT